MALPTILIHAVSQFLLDLENFRGSLASKRAAMASAVEYQVIERVLDMLVRMRVDIVDLKGRTGVGAYVQRVFGDQAVDIVARLNAVQTTIEAAGLLIRSSAPVDGSGYVLAYQLSPDANATVQWVYRTITVGQSAGLRGALDDVLAAIDALFDDLSG